MASIKNIVGLRSGRLTVIENNVGRDAEGRILCRCKCDCGNTVTITRQLMLNGYRTNCGCLHSKDEQLSATEQDIKEYILGLRNGTINGKIGATKYVE